MNNATVNKEATRAAGYKLMKISSTAFTYGASIPSKYTCDGDNINPPLHIEHIPADTKCLVIIVEDPDAPSGLFVHWLVWNIPVTHQIQENIVHGMQGLNSFGNHKYGGPCPPSGTHRYFFKVYALTELLDINSNSSHQILEEAISGLINGYGEHMGRYKKINSN